MTLALSPALLEALRDVLGPADVRPGDPMARYTTWRVGGPAALVVVPRSAAALERTVALVDAAGAPRLMLGRGSNVLADDDGIDAVVIVNRADHTAIEGARVETESGALLSVLARRSAAAGLAGLEWSHDIPGSVGGAVVNNAGAHGSTIDAVLVRARVLTAGGAVRVVERDDLCFSYRRSVLRAHKDDGAAPLDRRSSKASTATAAASPYEEELAGAVVLGATFHLTPADPDAVQARLAAGRAHRKKTQPSGASAGSVFKNPPGDSAGRLIESSGLKGMHQGGASISTLHANFIVAAAGATAADVVALVALARWRVFDAHGVILEPEIQCIYADGSTGPPILPPLSSI